MDTGAIDAIFIILSSLGGVAAIIGASGWARAARIRAERAASATLAADVVPDAVVVSELKAIKTQMAEMHSTSHQFDLSFDDALNRLEGRVSRIETKTATRGTSAEDTPAVQQNGTGH